MALLREQIRNGRKVVLTYRDEQGRDTERVIWPVTVGYLDNASIVIAWCELRQAFRSFRTDRVAGAAFLEERFPERPSRLRARWREALAAERVRQKAEAQGA
jgi:predicted DNA-binding transcriptional regulator YafY